MNTRIILRGIVTTILLYSLIVSQLFAVNTALGDTSISKPSWAEPGIKLKYAEFSLREKFTLDQINDVVSMLESGDIYFYSTEYVAIDTFKLLSTNSSHGTFQVTSIASPSAFTPHVKTPTPISTPTPTPTPTPKTGEGLVVYEWGAGRWFPISGTGTVFFTAIFNIPSLYIYRPLETLKDYPLVTFGNVKAYKVMENTYTFGKISVIPYFYYHENTGILVALISVITGEYRGELVSKVIVDVLISSNIIWPKPAWAEPGVKLTYSVLRYSDKSVGDVESLSSIIEKNFTYFTSMEPTYTVYYEFITVSEDDTTLLLRRKLENLTIIYSWITGYAVDLDNQLIYYSNIYKPPELLRKYPLISLGNYTVYKVPFGERGYNYYEKNTGILVFTVYELGISEPPQTWIILAWLTSSNVNFTSSTTASLIYGYMSIAIVIIIIIVVIAVAILLLVRRK